MKILTILIILWFVFIILPNKKMKRIINWWKMEWEIFCFVDSVEAMNLSKFEVDKRIELIKKKYKIL